MVLLPYFSRYGTLRTDGRTDAPAARRSSANKFTWLEPVIKSKTIIWAALNLKSRDFDEL